MFAWGSTVHGELGLGGIEDEQILSPRYVEWAGLNVKEAACGTSHTLLLMHDGKVYSCGNNDYGQLGHTQPRKRPRMSHFRMFIIFCINHCLLCKSNVLQSETRNATNEKLMYVLILILEPVPGLESYEIVHIACGTAHSMALNKWGQVYAWGSDSNGQLGLQAENKLQPVPKIVKALAAHHVIQISNGEKHSLALTNCKLFHTFTVNLESTLDSR